MMNTLTTTSSFIKKKDNIILPQTANVLIWFCKDQPTQENDLPIPSGENLNYYKKLLDQCAKLQQTNTPLFLSYMSDRLTKEQIQKLKDLESVVPNLFIFDYNDYLIKLNNFTQKQNIENGSLTSAQKGEIGYIEKQLLHYKRGTEVNHRSGPKRGSTVDVVAAAKLSFAYHTDLVKETIKANSNYDKDKIELLEKQDNSILVRDFDTDIIGLKMQEIQTYNDVIGDTSITRMCLQRVKFFEEYSSFINEISEKTLKSLIRIHNKKEMEYPLNANEDKLMMDNKILFENCKIDLKFNEWLEIAGKAFIAKDFYEKAGNLVPHLMLIDSKQKEGEMLTIQDKVLFAHCESLYDNCKIDYLPCRDRDLNLIDLLPGSVDMENGLIGVTDKHNRSMETIFESMNKDLPNFDNTNNSKIIYGHHSCRIGVNPDSNIPMDQQRSEIIKKSIDMQAKNVSVGNDLTWGAGASKIKYNAIEIQQMKRDWNEACQKVKYDKLLGNNEFYPKRSSLAI